MSASYINGLQKGAAGIACESPLIFWTQSTGSTFRLSYTDFDSYWAMKTCLISKLDYLHVGRQKLFSARWIQAEQNHRQLTYRKHTIQESVPVNDADDKRMA